VGENPRVDGGHPRRIEEGGDGNPRMPAKQNQTKIKSNQIKIKI
jgi:hypothetical protein